jgi:hypothetical protein
LGEVKKKKSLSVSAVSITAFQFILPADESDLDSIPSSPKEIVCAS